MDPQNALWQCSQRGESEDLAELLNGDYKFELNKPNAAGATALHLAAGGDHTKAISLLLDKGADLEVRKCSSIVGAAQLTLVSGPQQAGRDTVASCRRQKCFAVRQVPRAPRRFA